MDYSYLPSLDPALQAGAIRLQFEAAPANQVGWGSQAYYGTSSPYALAQSTFVVSLKAGTTYDLFSSSYFDPYILLLYNSNGSVVGADSGQGSYGSDIIFNFTPTISADFYVSASWHQGSALSNKYASVAVYEYGPPVTAPTPPNPDEGGPGIDTFHLSGRYDDYTVSPSSNKLVLSKKATGEVKTLNNVERLAFTDKTVAYDIDGNAGQAYRLYKAAFDRTPDKAGIGFWIGELDRGVKLTDVAAQFVTSDEFSSLNGANLSNQAFTASLYQHVLGRAPDAEGLAWWVSQIEGGGKSRPEVLTGFSESTENQIALQGVIQNGIEYDAHA